MSDIYDKVPLYYKLAENIEEQINNDIYEKGEKIPSERELCEIYGVSRMTVRLAIDELVKKGKLEKVQGKGTYVLSKSIVQNLNKVYSYSKEMNKQGKISSTKMIKRKIVKADEKLAKKLRVPIGENLLYIERLRLAENVPIMVEKTWFIYNVTPFLMDIDFTKKGLYKTLDEDYGIRFNKAIETFKATQLNSYECRLLNCPNDQYGLLIKRLSYSDDKIICCSSIVSKGDTFEFTVVLND
ncbi:MAG TPA: GntR family transcriptional regulator [Erysipelotrichaceae bacterium]|nr:GntR family transcriptional regulator [Erysipelotrichia bacterium]HPX32153.1 GntR family transcriptional regulator [Erysipelotrichaceae bacterium]HQA84514.1 GntR family transcriptional regulator [Erysipelotrichaceae bacterium]